MSLLLALGAALPVAWHFREQAKALDRDRLQAFERFRMSKATLQFVESRHEALTLLRRTASRFTAQAEARPIVAWPSLVGDLCRLKPNGVWMLRADGNGPRFKLEVGTARPELAAAYAQRLRQSAYLDFVSLPAGEAASTRTQVTGRVMGE